MNLRHREAVFGQLGFVLAGVLSVSLAGCGKKSQAGADGTTASPLPATTLSPVAAATGLTTAVAPAPAGGPGRKVGDRISVRWKGSCYASRILSVAKPGVYFITYEGYDHSWDETITEGRICGK